MNAPLTPAPAPGPDAPQQTGPRADSIADAAGGLTFDLSAPDSDAAPEWSAALVLRRRGGGAPSDEVRLPLGPNGAGRLRAVLPSTVALNEGRWDAFADFGDGADPQRLRPGINDLRSLVDRRPLAAIGRLGVRIPYATKYGNLALRSWLRGPHAESGELLVVPDGLTVSGRLYGAAPGAGAVAEAHPRNGKGPVLDIPLSHAGQDFSFTLPHAPLAERWRAGVEVWDLWLRPDADTELVRVSRILDDVLEKKQIFMYPAMPVDARAAQLRIGPYYTVDNDLAVRVEGPERE